MSKSNYVGDRSRRLLILPMLLIDSVERIFSAEYQINYGM